MTALAEAARAAHAAYRALKQHTTNQAGGPADLVPILTVDAGGGDSAILASPRSLLRAALPQLTAGRQPETLIYSSEVWMQTTLLEPEQGPRLTGRGELAAAFSAGDMTIREALVTVAVTKDASHVIISAYRYDDRGRPRFDPASSDDSAAWVGSIIADLRLAWT